MPRNLSVDTNDKKRDKGVATKTTWTNAVRRSMDGMDAPQVVTALNAGADEVDKRRSKGVASNTTWSNAAQRSTKAARRPTGTSTPSAPRATAPSSNRQPQPSSSMPYGQQPHSTPIGPTTWTRTVQSPYHVDSFSWNGRSTASSSTLTASTTSFERASSLLYSDINNDFANPYKSKSSQIPLIIEPDSAADRKTQGVPAPTSPSSKIAAGAEKFKAAFRRLSISGKDENDPEDKSAEAPSTPSGPTYVLLQSMRYEVTEDISKMQ